MYLNHREFIFKIYPKPSIQTTMYFVWSVIGQLNIFESNTFIWFISKHTIHPIISSTNTERKRIQSWHGRWLRYFIWIFFSLFDGWCFDKNTNQMMEVISLYSLFLLCKMSYSSCVWNQGTRYQYQWSNNNVNVLVINFIVKFQH